MNSDLAYQELPIGLCHFDLDLRYIFINDWLADLNGLSVENHIGRSITEVLPHLSEQVIPSLRQVIDSGVPLIGGEVTAETPSQPGISRTFQHSYIPIKSDTGSIIGLSCVVEEVTDLKNAEENLKKSNSKLEQQIAERALELQTALVSMTGGIFMFSGDLRIRVASPNFCEMYELPAEVGQVGSSAADIIRYQAERGDYGPGDPDELIEQRLNLYRSSDTTTIVDRIESGRLIELRFSPMPGGGIVSVFNDITERKRAETALQESMQRFREIVDIAPEAIISMSTDSKITFFNRGAERIFGYNAQEVLGQSLEILMPERFRRRHRNLVTEFELSSDTYRLMDRRQEIVALRKGGAEFPASASVSKSAMSENTCFTVMLSDVTDRREADERRRQAMVEAKKANKAKSEFLTNMSHELRTPLNAIIGFSGMIRNQYFGPIGNEKYLEYADDIVLSGKYLLDLVNQILDIERIEAGKYTLTKENIDIPALLGECQRIIQTRAEDGNISLYFDMPEKLSPLYADRRAIMQVLINLVTNAVKFTPQGGTVTVKAAQSANNNIFEISDTGIGIPKNKLKTIKEPFTRHEADPHKPHDGVGLGLAISTALVELHKGILKITSEEGKGTIVAVKLPIVTLAK